MLHIRLFGTGSARNGERALPRFPNQQPHLLLCYLALTRGQCHAREVLGALFWGDYPTAASRKYLRNTLWRLRQALSAIDVPADDLLQVRDGTLGLANNAPLYLDTESFEDTVTRYSHLAGADLAPQETEDLETATTLYTGALLEGVYEDWCIYERERLLLMYLRALGMLVDFHEANGTYHRGLAHGSRILECDNTRENVHRQMMRLHYRSGDRNAALVQYHRCESTMRQALCCAPTAETRRLYEQIARGESVPTPGAAADAPGLEQALRRLDRVETQLQQLSQELHSVASVIRSLATDGAAEPR